jgi:hypothetical protein
MKTKAVKDILNHHTTDRDEQKQFSEISILLRSVRGLRFQTFRAETSQFLVPCASNYPKPVENPKTVSQPFEIRRKRIAFILIYCG